MTVTKAHSAYLELLDHLEEADVRYAILHGWESLLDGNVSDLDLITSSDDLARVESVLIAHYRVLNVFQYEASGFGFVLSSRCVGIHSTLVADVSTDYRCRGWIFFTAEELLQSRERWRGYWVAAPAQEFEYLLVKKIYEKAAVPERQRTRIEELARRLGPDKVEASILRLFGRPWGKQLIDWIHHQRWARVEAHISQLQRCLCREVLKRDSRNPLRYWRAEICRFWARLRHPTGMSVALVGVHTEDDAATIVSALQDIPHAFRRIVMLKTASSANGRLTLPMSLDRIRQLLYSVLVLQIRVRILRARSALVIWKHNDSDSSGNRNRRTALSRLLGHFFPHADLLLTVGPPGSPLFLHPQEPARRLTREKHQAWAREQVVLNNCLQFSQHAREAIEEYLCKRYAAYRHLWFPG